MILAIVKENSATIAANSQIITSFKAFSERKVDEFVGAIARVHDRIDRILEDTASIRATVGRKAERKGAGRDEDNG